MLMKLIIYRSIFRAEDDPVLEKQFEENQQIEPGKEISL